MLHLQEEKAKRAQRAGRFNMPTQGLEWSAPHPAADDVKRRERAAKFGVKYIPNDTSGLMDVGAHMGREGWREGCRGL